VPFGVFLSGGIDSSTNVALMAELMDRPVDTFTVGFRDHTHLNELEYAQMMARRFNTKHHEVLIGEQDMIGYLDQLIHAQDEPIADWVCIPLYFVSKLARDSGTTVVQVGEGSDEQFSGYSGYMMYLDMYRRYWTPFRKYLPKVAQHGVAALARTAARMRPGLAPYADVVDRAARDREHFWSGAMVFWDLLKSKLVDSAALPISTPNGALAGTDLLPQSYLAHDSYNVVRSFLGPFDAKHPGSDVLTRMIHLEFKLRLPELLLMRVDKISMSTSVEARVPFLDHKLVEFAMTIPRSMKVRDGQNKWVLKKALEGIVDDDLLYRPKQGFVLPINEWFITGMAPFVEHALFSSPIRKRGFFDYDFIRSIWEQHLSGRVNYSFNIWSLLNLSLWYEHWIERRPFGIAEPPVGDHRPGVRDQER